MSSSSMNVDEAEAAVEAATTTTTTTETAISVAHQNLSELQRTQRMGTTRPQRQRQTLGEVMQMTFEEKRDEYVEQHGFYNEDLRKALAAATNTDELWAALNSESTRAVTQEELHSVNQLARSVASAIDGMEVDKDDTEEAAMMKEEKAKLELRNKMRNEVWQKYSVVDAKTGKRVLADLNNDEHRAQLRERMSLFVKKGVSPEQQDRLEAAAAYAMHMAEEREAPMLTSKEAAEYEESGKLPEDYEKKRVARIKRQHQMAVAAISDYNGIVSRCETQGISSCMPHRMPFATMLKDAMPLTGGFFTEALQKAARETRLSLITSNMYPTLVFESKLRLLMYGQAAPNVACSFRYHETVHAVFLALLGMDKKYNHPDFLEVEGEVLEKLKMDLEERRKDYVNAVNSCKYTAEELEAEVKQIEGGEKDNETFALGLQVAKKTWDAGVALVKQEHERKVAAGLVSEDSLPPPPMEHVRSPFELFLTRAENPWTQLNVPRHSKEEIVKIIEMLQEGERTRQNSSLKSLDEAFHASDTMGDKKEEWQTLRFKQLSEPEKLSKEELRRIEKLGKKRAKHHIMDTEQFLIEYWWHNHTSTVQTCKYFDTAILLYYEDNVPVSYRADLSIRSDSVPNNAIVANEVISDLEFQREFFRTMRNHYTERMTEYMAVTNQSEKVTHSGVPLDQQWLAVFGKFKVCPEDYASPTFAELAEFYMIVCKDYGCVENVAKILDFIDEAYSVMFSDDGALVKDYTRVLDQQRMEMDTNIKRRRMK